MKHTLWPLTLLAALQSACSLQTVKLELPADHPARPEAQAAQWPGAAQALSADDAVRLALAHSPALQADYAKLGIARAEVLAATVLPNPTLSFERHTSSVGVERSIGLMQDLVGLLTLPARKQLAQRNLARAEMESAQRVLAHGHAVRSAYYTLQGDAQAVELLGQAAGATAAAAELAQRQFAAGNVSRLQLAQHQAFNAETRLEYSQAQAHLAAQREQVNALIGAWGKNARWTLPQRLPPLPAQPPQVNADETAAMSQRLDLAAAKQQLESSQAALEFARRNRFLSSLGIGFSRTRTSDGEKLKGPGIELGLPLFDRAQGEIARLQAESQTQQHGLSQLAIEIRAQVRAAGERLTAAHKRAQEYASTLLPLHETIVNETQLRYNGMLSDVYELLAAKRAQLGVARGYVDSLREYWLALVELELALGTRLQQTPPPAEESAMPTPPSNEDHHHKH